MGFDVILALWWDIWQTPYFKVFETKGNKVVKVFNQKVVNSQEGSNIALIDMPNKIAWWVTEDYIIWKSRIIFICDINNAVPLIIKESKELSGNLIIKEKTKRAVIVDAKKQKENKKNGNPLIKAEIHYPSTMLYQLLEAHFVKKVLAQPKSKWEELKWVIIVAILAGAFLLWSLMGSGLMGGGKLG